MFTAELYHVGKKEREKRGADLLELFGLTGRRNDKTNGFSKGMKRRLTLAMGGDTHFNPVIDIVMLCIFILIFQFVANRLYKKFNERCRITGNGKETLPTVTELHRDPARL